MGRVRFEITVSLDGFVAGPGGDLSWHRVDDVLMTHYLAREAEVGAHLYGRRLYEAMLYWQDHDADAPGTGSTLDYGPLWRRKPKFVAARALPRPADNTRLIDGYLAGAVAAIRAEVEGDILVGGPTLAASLMRAGLVDEFSRYVVPVVIGEGLPCFPEPVGRLEMELVEVGTFPNGVVRERYRVLARG